MRNIFVLLIFTSFSFASKLEYLQIDKKTDLNEKKFEGNFIIDDYKKSTPLEINLNEITNGPLPELIQKKMKSVKKKQYRTDFKVIKHDAVEINLDSLSKKISEKNEEQKNKSIEKKSEHNQKLVKKEVAKKVSQASEIQAEINNEVKIYSEIWKLGDAAGSMASNFEIRENWSDLERHFDRSQGVVTISNTLGRDSVLNVSLIAPGAEIVNTDIRLFKELYGDQAQEVVIPFIDSNKFNETLVKYAPRGGGGHLLVDLHEKTSFVILDTNRYSKKLYINEKLKFVGESDQHRYILYLNLLPGNHTLTYIKDKNQEYNRVVNVKSDEITYEYNFYEAGEQKEIKIFQSNLITKTKSKKTPILEKLNLFSSNSKIKLIGNNKLRLARNSIIPGERDYFEYQQGGNTLYLGIGEGEKLEIPENDYIDYVLGLMDLDNLENMCFLQFNIDNEQAKKRPKKFTLTGFSQDNTYINHETYYLSSDGQFTEKLNPTTKKIFVLGPQNGVFHAMIESYASEKQYFNTYCKNGSYLVEHL